MAETERPDGVRLHWELKGDDGPMLVLAAGSFSYPEVYEDVISDLATDHRALTYHARGFGRSTRSGPYEMETDAADLLAVLEDAGGRDAVVAAVSDGGNWGVRAATERPDLVGAVAVMGGMPVPRRVLEGAEGLISSSSVVEMMFEQARIDYRSAVHAMTASFNPQLDERAIHERVATMIEYAPAEAVLPRAEAWDRDDPLDAARALGGRLWLLRPPDDPWLSPTAVGRLRELLPDANVVELEVGPLSGPGVAASVLRDVTASVH
jgi:pimeloyl-ACP methyl ester carboxylesterase